MTYKLNTSNLCLFFIHFFVKMKSSNSLNSTASDDSQGGRMRRRFDAHRVKGFRNKLELIYKPALQKVLIALTKESSQIVLSMIIMIVEALQLISFAFENVNW